MIQHVKRWLGFGSTATNNRPGLGFVAAPVVSAAGTTVNETTALTIPSFFHGIRLFGTVLGSLDFDVIRYLDRGSEIAREHPVHRLLHDEPNEFQTASAFWTTHIGHLKVWGNAYAYIERNGDFRPIALLPLLPDRTRPKRQGGVLVYETVVNGKVVELQPYEVFHVSGFGIDGLSGLPLVQVMRDALGLTKAETEYASALFANYGQFGNVFETAGKLSDAAKANLRASFEGGLGNAFKNVFLEEGLTLSNASGNKIDPEKAQLLGARQFSLVTMSQIIGLSPHLLGDLSRATFSNIEHLAIEAVNLSFRPITRSIEQEANRKLFYESEKFTYSCRINLTPLTQGDSKTQADILKARFDMCAITPNGVRAHYGDNPLPGLDEPFLNTALLPLSIAIKRALAANTTTPAAIAQAVSEVAPAAPQTPAAPVTNELPPADPSAGVAEPDGQPGPDVPDVLVEDIRAVALDVLKPIALDVATRLTNRDAKAVANARRKHGDNPESFAAWVASYGAETRSIVVEAVTPIASSIVALGGSPLDLDAIADRYVATIEKEDRVSAIANDILGGLIS